LKSPTKISSKLPLRKQFLIGLLFILIYSSLSAQANLEDIGNTLKQGDAKGLSAYFDKQIDLGFDDKTKFYSKKQAELIIQNFFSKVEPISFTNKQSGKSPANKAFFILGNMSTSNGMYRVYMLFVMKNGNYLLREIRFEK
jgi:hypothetical protein